jgi:hypothetical protein
MLTTRFIRESQDGLQRNAAALSDHSIYQSLSLSLIPHDVRAAFWNYF